MTRFTRPGAAIAALLTTGATALAACDSPGTGPAAFPGAFGKIPPAAPGPQHAGTITWAKPPGTAPTWILPLVTAANFNARNTGQFSSLSWRPLYWFSHGVQPAQTPAMSLANPPVWSNRDKTVTVTLKRRYKWSDGQPITSKDVLFTFDEIKAAIAESPANWGPYTPGLGIPDEVASVATPGSSTIVFNLKKAVNPGWFYDDELPSLSPLPAHAWARASASGPALDFTVPANAKKIWDFLDAAARSEATYTSNPLWQVVDGPYKLTQFNSGSGAFTMTPNPAYGGPHARKMSVLQAVPFTSDTAEFNAVRAGSIDVGYLPLTDIKQVRAVKAGGYNVFGYPGFGFSYIPYNFLDKTGNFDKIVAQLYFRQAMAHLENEKGWIKTFLDGAGGQSYGPIPAIPRSPYAPADAVTGPYPFSVSTAISLLKRHGWTVIPGGTDTCAKPGTGPGQCGAGVPAGTKLSFNLIYTRSPAVIGAEMTDLASRAARAGIKINLQSSDVNDIVTNYDNPVPSGKPHVNKWATENFGGFTDVTYPTTLSIFNGPGSLNEGSYASPTADRLIQAAVASSDPNAVRAEASFLTRDQPGLFTPNPDHVAVWKTALSGTPNSFASLTQAFLNPEYWYFTK